jgi:hypothetical protein
MVKNASLGAYGIMYVIQTKRNQVINLLLKNGVVVPMNATDMQIALLVTNLLKVSKSFYKDFSALLISQDTIKGMSLNMSGSYSNVVGDGQVFDFSVFQGGTPTTTNFAPTTPAKTTTPAKSTSGNVSWLNQGLELLQTGFQGYLQLDENKTKRELADASVKISADEVNKKEDLPPPTGLGTGAIIGISLLGVTIVGLVIYLITKNKNQ